MLNWVPDKLYLKMIYRATFNKKINFENPKTFNEKLQWLKLYDRKPFYTQIADKYEARQYIANIIGTDYLIPLLGVWDKFEDIDFTALPNQFVLKCTHDSGGVVICKDKSSFNQSLAKTKINKCMKKNYYYPGREKQYKDIKPRIIAEAYLEDEGGELNDYKIMCFNGKVKCSFVCTNRYSSTGLFVNFYDAEWNDMPFFRYFPKNPTLVKKPDEYEEMVMLTEKLAQDIVFIRVDFYKMQNKIYIGELTLHPGGGFEPFTPEKYDEILGSWIELPKTQKTNMTK